MQKELTIPSTSGAQLATTIVEPESPTATQPIAVMAHGFTTSRNSNKAQALTPLLNALGIAVLRFDFFGHGDSTGHFEDITITKGKQDIISCVEYARNELGYQNTSVFGSSFGGATALMAAAEFSPQLSSLVLIAPVTNWRKRDDEEYDQELLDTWRTRGYRLVEHSEHGQARLNYGFYLDEEHNNGWEAAPKVSSPTLIIHGDADSLVPIEHSRHAATLFPSAQLLEIPGCDHWFREGDSFQTMINASAEFFKQNLT